MYVIKDFINNTHLGTTHQSRFLTSMCYQHKCKIRRAREIPFIDAKKKNEKKNTFDIVNYNKFALPQLQEES